MFKEIRNNIIAGIFVALPIIITLYLLAYLIRQLGDPVTQMLFVPIFEHYDSTFQKSGLGRFVIDSISTIIVIGMLAIVGFLSKFFFGKMAIGFSERVLGKIPIANAIYGTVKQIVDTFSKKEKTVFKSVVLIEFPRKGSYSVGFLSNEVHDEITSRVGTDLSNVFVPTTPNPTSGFLMQIPKSEVIHLDMSVSDGMKFIVSFGAVIPEWKVKELKDGEAKKA